MSYRLTLKETTPVTHDVNRLVFDKPKGFTFTPGQATELSLDRDGWREEGRPFTFTSFPEDDFLEFTIKSYPEHDGVTEQIGMLKPGDTVLISDAWGAIEDKGPGTFIAGGAGITPFIPILRKRIKTGQGVAGCHLIFSNATEKDIILRDEWEEAAGLYTTWVVTEEEVPGLHNRQIDADFLREKVADTNKMAYVCGPDKMVEEVVKALKEIGVPDDKIVTEEA